MAIDEQLMYERARNRRKYITILYSCGVGVCVSYALCAVHGLLLGSVVAILSLYHYTRKIDAVRRTFLIGGP